MGKIEIGDNLLAAITVVAVVVLVVVGVVALTIII